MRRWACIADGTRWKVLTEEETENRFEITHDKLSEALCRSQVFTAREWKEMGIKGLRVGHIVRAGGAFFYGPEEISSNYTLSGDVAQTGGEAVEIEIEPRAGPANYKVRRKAVLKSRRERQRRVIMGAVIRGEEPDDRGRWAIQRIVQVERPPTSRRGRPLRVLVNWESGRTIRACLGRTHGLGYLCSQLIKKLRHGDLRERHMHRRRLGKEGKSDRRLRNRGRTTTDRDGRFG